MMRWDARELGRLVAPDQGFGEDVDADRVADDVGIDGGAASAEEAAVHVIEDEELAGLAHEFRSGCLSTGERGARKDDRSHSKHRAWLSRAGGSMCV